RHGDGGGRADVQLKRGQAGVGDGGGVAGGGVDLLGAAVEKGLGEGGADASVGAGDEGDCSFDLHLQALLRGGSESVDETDRNTVSLMMRLTRPRDVQLS